MIYKRDTQINFYDLDGRGDVKLTALLKHINLAAGANADEIGVGLETTIPMGLAFVIQRFALRIFKWPVYNQTVTIRTWPAEIAKGTFRRNGDMWDKEGNKLAEWTGLWVLIDINERKVRRPKALPIDLPAYGGMGVTVEAEKIEIPEDGQLMASYPHVVRFSETDINMHMNNAVYGDLIANVLEISENPLSHAPNWQEVQFNYIAETKVDEEVNVQLRQSEKNMFVSGIVDDKLVFTAVVKC
ncbi:MAG: thioesterase [Defluviitaleaceae bacterium]|nr:thioesterase [Defluviitaleaceae bacterium]